MINYRAYVEAVSAVEARNRQQAQRSALHLLLACFLIGRFLESEDGSSMTLRKVGDHLATTRHFVREDSNFHATKLSQNK